MNDISLPDLLPTVWWEVPKAEADEDQTNPTLARKVVETVQDIETRQFSIFEGNRRHAKIYAGYLPNALTWGTSPTASQRSPFEATKAVVRSVCDTATALIVRSRPKASFVTDGGDWKIQHQAEDMDQFMVGAYALSGIYQVAPRSFHDSTVFGTGAWKYVPEGSGETFKVCVERVLPDDLIVDEEECREHLEPQNTYHRTMVRVDAVIRKYAMGDTDEARSLRYKIRAAASSVSWPNRHVPKDRLVLIEAIHVGEQGPRHVICIPGAVLKDEPWPYDWHPYTVLWWSQPISGFYGDGIAYRQYGRQQRITYLYRWVQKCHDLFATPRAWVDPAGGPPTMQLSNELGAIVMCRKPPTIQTQAVVPPEIYRWLDDLERGGFEDEGISQVSASNQLPPGLESAPAQREYSFKEGQRFAPVSQRWEHAIAVDAATKMAAMYCRASKDAAKPKVKWADRRLLHTIEWPDLDVDAYVIRPEASSLDSLSPSARMQTALELAQTGWIDPKEGRALLGHPDLDASRDLDTAPETYAKWVLRKLYRGEQVAVDELADLGTLDRIIRSGRLLAIQKSAPQTIVDGLARFLEELDIEKQKATAAMMPPPGAPTPGMSQPAAMGSPAPFPGG